MKCVLCNNDKFNVITNKVRHDIPVKIIECKNCSLVSLENPTKIYTNYDDSEYRKRHSPIIGKTLSPREMFDLEIKFQNSRINRIKKLLKSDFRVLEIGSSTGHFLYGIHDMVKETTGIELNSEQARFSKNELGLNIHDQPLGKAPLKQNYYDIIFMFQVFEHIPNPLEFLEICKKYMKRTGMIYLEVPNIKDVLLYIYKIPQFRDFYFRLPHVYYYSETTLKSMLSKVGFIGKTQTCQEYTLFNHIHWLITGTPQSSKDDAYNVLKWNDYNASKKIDSNIIKFFSSANEKYKKLLEKNGIAETICYSGKLVT